MTLLVWLASIDAGSATAQTLTLAPRLLVFDACVGGPNPPSQAVAVTNAAAAPLTWQLVDPAGHASWLRVAPARGSTPESIDFTVDVAGLPRGQYQDTVPVASSEASNPVQDVVVILSVEQCAATAPPGERATWLVEFRYTGYTGLITADDCPTDPQGYDVLVGTITGIEGAARETEVIYRGTLRRSTSIDFCESKGRRSPDDDERDLCAVKLIGDAVMDVELAVYGEEGRGAHLEAVSWSSPVFEAASGACDAREIAQILADYPTAPEGGGATPNGQPIDDPQSLLFTGGLARLRVGYWPPEQEDGWSLRVIRRVR